MIYLLGLGVTIAVLIYWGRKPRTEDEKPIGRVRGFVRAVVAKFWFAAQWGLFIALALAAVRLLLNSELIEPGPVGIELGLVGTIMMICLVAISGVFTYFALIFVLSLIAWPARAWKARKSKTVQHNPDEKPGGPASERKFPMAK